ncbi:MAG TPA: hypothetical protein VF601_24280 [Beijerinckiaceae bacterium]|jgi:hypothetical protein
MSRDDFKPAIDTLLLDLADLERQALETKQVINRLCARAGMDILFPDATASATQTMGTLRPDSFYGKAITTAAREFLEMRRAANLGPATPREVAEALSKGGYTFETKDEATSIISVRNTLRKNSGIFHRLPNGTYGLLSWYPNARPPKDDDEGEEREAPRPSKAKPGKQPPPKKPQPKPAAAPRQPSSKPAEAKPAAAPPGEPTKQDRIRNELRTLLAERPRTRNDILEHLSARGIMGHEKDPLGNLAAYLSKWKDLVATDASGNWALVTPKTNEPPSGGPQGGSEPVEG